MQSWPLRAASAARPRKSHNRARRLATASRRTPQEAKTAATFVTATDGRRYAVSGDWARWEDGGLITLLGRGSTTINTGGEKVHPEEVEQALKDHPAVFD